MNPDPALAFPAASAFARHTDTLFFTLVAVGGAIMLALGATMVIFCIRYRAGSAADRSHPPAERPLEAAWITAALLAFGALFAWSAHDYSALGRPPAGAARVYVVAKQWTWTLEHAGGRREIDELHVPLGQPVRLLMTSQDVIHSFYVPALRIKQDVLPGRYTTLWFRADRPGRYRLLCAEFCGTAHASMAGGVVVMPPAAYARWLAAGAVQEPLRARGLALFREQGCAGCHGPASTVHAPGLDHVFGRRVVLSDGSSVVADEDYLRDAILVPGKQIVAGYAPIMPSFAAQLSTEDVTALIEYLREPGNAPPSEPRRP